MNPHSDEVEVGDEEVTRLTQPRFGATFPVKGRSTRRCISVGAARDVSNPVGPDRRKASTTYEDVQFQQPEGTNPQTRKPPICVAGVTATVRHPLLGRLTGLRTFYAFHHHSRVSGVAPLGLHWHG